MNCCQYRLKQRIKSPQDFCGNVKLVVCTPKDVYCCCLKVEVLRMNPEIFNAKINGSQFMNMQAYFVFLAIFFFVRGKFSLKSLTRTWLVRLLVLHTSQNSLYKWTKNSSLEIDIFDLKMMVKSGLETDLRLS